MLKKNDFCIFMKTYIPANIYLFKVNNRNTRRRCEICSKLSIRAPGWHQGLTNGMSKILTKFDLDSLNAPEEEWKLVRAFAQITLSFLIAYFSSMLSGYSTWVGWVSQVDTNFHFSSDVFKESKWNFVSIELVQFIIPIHLHLWRSVS